MVATSNYHPLLQLAKFCIRGGGVLCLGDDSMAVTKVCCPFTGDLVSIDKLTRITIRKDGESSGNFVMCCVSQVAFSLLQTFFADGQPTIWLVDARKEMTKRAAFDRWRQEAQAALKKRLPMAVPPERYHSFDDVLVDSRLLPDHPMFQGLNGALPLLVPLADRELATAYQKLQATIAKYNKMVANRAERLKQRKEAAEARRLAIEQTMRSQQIIIENPSGMVSMVTPCWTGFFEGHAPAGFLVAFGQSPVR